MAETPTSTAAATKSTTLTPTLLSRLLALDTSLSLLLHTLSLPLIPRPLLTLLEISGDGRFLFPVTLSLLPLSRSPFLLSLLVGALLDLLLVGLLKFLVRRPRPVYNNNMSLVVAVDQWSFPSGHSSRVFLIAFFVYVEAEGGILMLDGWVVGGILVWAAATAVSRVLLGRHFVMDVVAGAGLGVAEAVVTQRFLKFEICLLLMMSYTCSVLHMQCFTFSSNIGFYAEIGAR